MIADAILALIDLAGKLAARAAQTGELTPEQRAEINARAAEIFSKYENAPPPPRS